MICRRTIAGTFDAKQMEQLTANYTQLELAFRLIDPKSLVLRHESRRRNLYYMRLPQP